MHLAFLTSEYPHPQSNPAAGIGTSIKNLATALSKRGVQISVFIYGQNKSLVQQEGKIKIHIIKRRSYKILGWYFHRKYIQNYINKYIAIDNIQAVEAPEWTGITAFMSLNCLLTIRLHGSDTYFCHLENRPQKKKNYWFEKFALKKANYLISVSQFTADKTAELFKLKSKIEVIPNSVDVEYFIPPSTPTKKGTLLYFGSVIRKKGVLELAEIFNITIKRQANTKLLIAGNDVKDLLEGKSTLELLQEKLSTQAKDNVEWLGVLPYEQVKEKIAAANVVVLPSFAEALPMTWIEAMAMEKSLVTSNIGWANEVMADGITGFTVDPREHELYADKILKLINDPALAEKMGKAARKKVVNEFSTDLIAKKNITFYNSVIFRKKIS